MRSRDCRHYSRRELIEVIYELERRTEKLERRLNKAKRKLNARSLQMENAGSLAEVAAVISGIFEAADETAQHAADWRAVLESVQARGGTAEEMATVRGHVAAALEQDG